MSSGKKNNTCHARLLICLHLSRCSRCICHWWIWASKFWLSIFLHWALKSQMEKDCSMLKVITFRCTVELGGVHPAESLVKAGRSRQHSMTLQRERFLLLAWFYLASDTVQWVWERPAEPNSEKSNIIHWNVRLISTCPQKAYSDALGESIFGGEH